MKIRKVLVVYKKSAYQVYAQERGDKNFLALIRKRHGVVRRFLSTHATHSESLEKVQAILRKRKIETRYVYRAHHISERGYDLVLTVGGDGTFLEASHSLVHVPVLGLNSSPKDSVGMFCGARADTLEEILDGIQARRIKPIELTRLQVKVGRKKLPVHVLNDILVAHRNPAATSRHLIRWRGKTEEHKSSGIWVATAAGSSAAIGAAGGRLLPIQSRNFQFLVRELYTSAVHKPSLRTGIVKGTETLKIFSKLRAGRVYLDGPHSSCEFPLGETMEVTTHAPRLRVFAFNDKRRRLLWR